MQSSLIGSADAPPSEPNDTLQAEQSSANAENQSQGGDPEISSDENGKPLISITAPVGGVKKKKKRKKGPTAMPKERGTGFEEYFCDPPISPAEALEEKKKIYNPDRPFNERMEECLQRYRDCRRLGGDITKYFNSWLFLGGVDTSPRQFQGVESRDLDGLDDDEKRRLTGIDTIHVCSGSAGEKFYSLEAEDWEVDFPGVAAGFFSVSLPHLTGWSVTGMSEGIAVVENFLRYLLMHDACPEYDGQIKEALAICAYAKIELPLVMESLNYFPGQFNLACKELYCKEEEKYWDMPGESSRPPGFEPRYVFTTTMALQGTREQVQSLGLGSPVHVVSEVQCHMEVDQIIRLDPTNKLDRVTLNLYRSVKPLVDEQKHFVPSPVGKAILKPTWIEDGWDYKDMWSGPFYPTEPQALFLDDDILARLRPGFKMALTICELNIGIKFIKAVHKLCPSFHAFLPQELMRYYKQPRVNDRPPPRATNLTNNELEVEVEGF